MQFVAMLEFPHFLMLQKQTDMRGGCLILWKGKEAQRETECHHERRFRDGQG